VLALDVKGTIFSWGQNDFGQLGYDIKDGPDHRKDFHDTPKEIEKFDKYNQDKA
jgi:alpha-tubulin suppressor-like RCC1 family protein